MTGGLIQLVAYGVENMFLTDDPQITYFKTVYKRHTNFSKVQVQQYFAQTPNFGEKVSCTLSKNGDLIGEMFIVVKIPEIRKFNTTTGLDQLTKFAWAKRLGYTLIKSVEVEINGRTIDRHYGEWLNILNELFGRNDRGLKIMIGDVEELTSFTNGKNPYTLYIPLKFWFCKSSGLALPIICMQYCDLKINVEFNTADYCYVITPTDYIKCEADLVNFEEYEYIEQVIDGEIHAGIFTYYDILQKRLYYTSLTPTKKFVGIPSDLTTISNTQKQEILADTSNAQYKIIGKTSKFEIFSSIKETSKSHQYTKIRNLNMIDAYLLIDYIYVDDDERVKIARSRHDYLIDQLHFTPDIILEGSTRSVRLTIDHPCEYMVWLTQLSYIKTAKDYFNYTDGPTRKIKIKQKYHDRIFKEKTLSDKITIKEEYPELDIGDPVGESIIEQETIMLNSKERLTLRTNDYFNNIQCYQHCRNRLATGLNFYSFALYPNLLQPSGSCNMSQIEKIEITMRLNHKINSTNTARFRGYVQTKNILRISGGFAALVFIR